MYEQKPQPIISARVYNRCPVCGEVSYSLAGIHPQCSVQQADEQRKVHIKREKLLEKEKNTGTSASGISPWQKRCPKCNAVQHVRKAVCDCGHTFTVRARPPTSDDEPT
jgi:hypothetical protein